jgi:hypothetical protein
VALFQMSAAADGQIYRDSVLKFFRPNEPLPFHALSQASARACAHTRMPALVGARAGIARIGTGLRVGGLGRAFAPPHRFSGRRVPYCLMIPVPKLFLITPACFCYDCLPRNWHRRIADAGCQPPRRPNVPPHFQALPLVP